MKKILSIIICICILAFCLVACSGSNTTEAQVEEIYRFTSIADTSTSGGDRAHIFIDHETGVCYLYVEGYECCTVTVMVDADGKPVIWSGG